MHMSTPEQIEFQLLHKDGEEPKAAVYPDGQEPLEQPDDAAKGAVGRKITSRWKKISLTVLTLLGYAFVYAAMSDVTAFYAILAQNHNVATYIAGFVLGVNSLCLASLAPVIGYILPHLGLKFTQVAGLFLTAGSQLLFGFVSKMPTPTLFIAFSFLLKAVEGIGLTMFATGSLTLLTQLYLERKGTFGSLIELSVSIGFIVGVSVGGGLQEVGGFVLPLLVFGGISLSLTLLLLVNVHPTECTSAKVPWRIVFKMFKSVWFVLIVLCAVISIVTSSSLSAFFGHFLSMHFGLRVGIIGVIYLSGLAVNTLATLSAGLIADKLKIPRYLLIGGLVVGFAGCVLIGPAMFITTPKLWLSIIAWMMFQTAIPFSCVPIYPAMYGVAKMLHVEEAVLASTVAGFVVASFSLGAFLGPIIGGVLVHQVGFPSMAAITGLTLLVHALVLVIATVIEKIWSRRMKAQK